jgi:hypothetical protein
VTPSIFKPFPLFCIAGTIQISDLPLGAQNQPRNVPAGHFFGGYGKQERHKGINKGVMMAERMGPAVARRAAPKAGHRAIAVGLRVVRNEAVCRLAAGRASNIKGEHNTKRGEN